ncbi:hypothetical protein C8R45DRAFT_1009595 [Mycena sanguinolenta]|nr:hypothetical protein C8R45DRAFT_1009595 [Mycena sanguinolenta]
MHFVWQFLRRVGRSRSSPVGCTDIDDLPKRNISDKRPQSVIIDTEAARTATNALVFALRTLSTVSNGIPLAGALSGIIDPLVEITTRIKQTSANAHALAQLAARINRLAPIVARMAQDDPDKGQAIVQNLHQELVSMTDELKVAGSRGKLNRFFNSVENTSVLQKHNNVLAQMIADCTLDTVQGVSQSLRALENSKLQERYPDIGGGTGGTGGNGDIGGEGGEGGGPQIDMDPDERPQIGNIYGGTGGTGGIGVQVGGKGGTGKGPVINMRRMRALTIPVDSIF